MTRILALLILAASCHSPPVEHPLPTEERSRLERSLKEALARAEARVTADPRGVEGFSQRGDARFFRRDFKGAVADYDRMVELDAALSSQHWRRGIALFYAGEFGKAAAQFEAYHSFDDVDRENGIWRFLSQAKAHGLAKAREGLLQYRKDDREPFPDVYRLFAGTIRPEEILARIGAAPIDDGQREVRLFYAELYIGLNFAVEDRAADAVRHLGQAVANRWGPKGGYGPAYMWHVGRLHFERLSR